LERCKKESVRDGTIPRDWNDKSSRKNIRKKKRKGEESISEKSRRGR